MTKKMKMIDIKDSVSKKLLEEIEHWYTLKNYSKRKILFRWVETQISNPKGLTVCQKNN